MIVRGDVRVPGDKSISHRALILAALANGISRIHGILESADVHSTAGVLRSLGVEVPALSSAMAVRGAGPGAFRQSAGPLDCGNSGTTTRLMAGVAAGLPFSSTFVGDASLSRRPMRRVARPLEAMGARVELPEHGGLPMTVHGGRLRSTQWVSEVASAQVKSAVLLAAVTAGVPASVVEPGASRDHTERMLAARGVTVMTDGARIAVEPSPVAPLDTRVPGDPSSAAFLVALAALADDGALQMRGVCINPTRTGFFRALRAMGGRVDEVNIRNDGGESVADVQAAPARLAAIAVGAAMVPAMVDELPLLACVAARAQGTTEITGASELRVKESDRIAAVVANLRAIGVEAEELPDGMRVTGTDAPLRGRVTTYGDYRLAMAFGVLGATRNASLQIDDRDCVSVSYPEFWNDVARATGAAA